VCVFTLTRPSDDGLRMLSHQPSAISIAVPVRLRRPPHACHRQPLRLANTDCSTLSLAAPWSEIFGEWGMETWSHRGCQGSQVESLVAREGRTVTWTRICAGRARAANRRCGCEDLERVASVMERSSGRRAFMRWDDNVPCTELVQHVPGAPSFIFVSSTRVGGHRIIPLGYKFLAMS
jgi:hypothetical protein